MPQLHTVTRREQPVANLGTPGLARNRLVARAKAAIGKAFLVYLGTGSIGAAIVAFLIFKMMGC